MVDAPRSIGASGSGRSHCSAGSTNSVPRPGVAPSATRRFVSAGRAAQSRSCSRGCGSTFTPRHPRSANAAVTESNTGSPAPTSSQKPLRSSGCSSRVLSRSDRRNWRDTGRDRGERPDRGRARGRPHREGSAGHDRVRDARRRAAASRTQRRTTTRRAPSRVRVEREHDRGIEAEVMPPDIR